MDLKQEVGRRVRQHREAAGLSQIALGERIGRSVQSVRKIESGRSAPTFETLAALSSALGVPVSSLFPNEAVAAPDEMTAQVVRLLAALDREERARVLRIVVAAVKG